MAETSEPLERQIEELGRRLRRSLENQRRLEDRVLHIESSIYFRALRGVYEFCAMQKRALRHKFGGSKPSQDEYAQWIERQARVSDAPLRRKPSISILMAVRQPRQRWFEAAIRSVLEQTYECWELCVVVDAGFDEKLARLAGADPRVRRLCVDEPLGMADSLNRAGAMARGEYVAWVGHEDRLDADALHQIAAAVQDAPADLIYSDEDALDPSERRRNPIFKPDWSPELLLSGMYVGGLLVVSWERMDRAGWFRPAFEGAHEYDLALRLAESPVEVRHVPRVLYHRGGSDWDAAAELRALSEAIARRGWNAEVAAGPRPRSYRVRRQLTVNPLVSVIICSRNPALLRRCLQSLREKTRYSNFEMVVVEHGAGLEAVSAAFSARSVRYAGPFHYPNMNASGVAAAVGEHLLFLNDDIEPLDASWMSMMAAQLARPEVGVVGARLLYPNGAIQHAGAALGMTDAVGHPGRGQFSTPYWPWLESTREVTAVTGACLGIRREVFDECGGFDPAFPVNYNDIDLCLRVRQRGWQVIYEASAVLRHDECATRTPGTRFEERELFHDRWGCVLDRADPYYSPNLLQDREDGVLR